VLDEDVDVIKNIQVKTRSRGVDGGWHMKKKHEDLISPLLWYVFVAMEPASPTCHVIPSEVVANVVRVAHETWMATPGNKGQAHKDTDMRRVRPKYPFPMKEFSDGWMDQHLERWDLLRTSQHQESQIGSIAGINRGTVDSYSLMTSIT